MTETTLDEEEEEDDEGDNNHEVGLNGVLDGDCCSRSNDPYSKQTPSSIVVTVLRSSQSDIDNLEVLPSQEMEDDEEEGGGPVSGDHGHLDKDRRSDDHRQELYHRPRWDAEEQSSTSTATV